MSEAGILNATTVSAFLDAAAGEHPLALSPAFLLSLAETELGQAPVEVRQGSPEGCLYSASLDESFAAVLGLGGKVRITLNLKEMKPVPKEADLTYNLGIVLMINGQPVPVSPSQAVTNAKLNGINLELPQRVEIGSVGEIGAFMTDTFGIEGFDGQNLELPEPFDTIGEKLLSCRLAVEQMTLFIPPTKKTVKDNPEPQDIPAKDRDPVTFSLGMSAMWTEGDEIQIIDGKLGVKGVFFKVERVKKSEAKPVEKVAAGTE